MAALTDWGMGGGLKSTLLLAEIPLLADAAQERMR
jgi:hypothetical protein